MFHYYIVAHQVMLLARELGLGGTERQLTETALALDRSGFEPHVGCFTAGGFRARELRDAGVPILELGVTSFASPSALAGARRMGAYLAEHRIELVHAFDVPMDLFAVPVARFFRVPAVLSSQRASRSLTPGATRHLLRLTDRMAHGIIVNSQAVARELSAEDGVAASKVRLVYNGVDTALFRREGDGAELPWASGGVVIGVVCALRPEKGLELLLDAFARARHTYPEARLVIVGSGPMLETLRESASDACHFEPAVKDVAPWLRTIDVFVLPSLSEALSNSLMEAMACGCCAIASDVGGNPELIAHGQTGLLFPSGDAGALAARLDLVLRDAELRRRLAVNAERRMHTEFTREIAARRMGEVYLEFLGRRY
jgi:glycosyltransferase involved in cell wall biosynthesis